MFELIFISGSFVKSKEYRKVSDIDLICLEEDVEYIYSEIFAVEDIRFQITFMPYYKLSDVIASDIATPDRIYVNMLEDCISVDDNGAEVLTEIKDYIEYMKRQCNRIQDIHVCRQLSHIKELCSEISDERNNSLVIGADLFRTLLSFVTGLPNTTSKHIGRVVLGNLTAERVCATYIESVTNEDYSELVAMAMSAIKPFSTDGWKSSTGISYNLPTEPYLIVFIPSCKSRQLVARNLMTKFELCCKDALFYGFYVGNNQFMECGTYLYIRNNGKLSTQKLLVELYKCHRELAKICIREDLKIIFPYRTAFDAGYKFGGKAIFNILYPFFCKIYAIERNCNGTGIALGLAVCDIWKNTCTEGRVMLEQYMDILSLDAVDPNCIYNVVQAGYMRATLKEYYDSMTEIDFPLIDTAVNDSLAETMYGLFNSVQQIDENDIHIIRIFFHDSKKNTMLINILNHVLSIFNLDVDEKFAVVHYCLKHCNDW